MNERLTRQELREFSSHLNIPLRIRNNYIESFNGVKWVKCCSFAAARYRMEEVKRIEQLGFRNDK